MITKTLTKSTKLTKLAKDVDQDVFFVVFVSFALIVMGFVR